VEGARKALQSLLEWARSGNPFRLITEITGRLAALGTDDERAQ